MIPKGQKTYKSLYGSPYKNLYNIQYANLHKIFVRNLIKIPKGQKTYMWVFINTLEAFLERIDLVCRAKCDQRADHEENLRLEGSKIL